ncbi:hypothetical protein [Paraburkholderia hayleyella]|uniref:hypothetical protein n=1 Tax=Paraburkholderia hayleyella TaxID=2152889 RepID=UPI001290AD86|nr:hypothetical protein [Paraburkholderia hayleyella]
MKKFLILKPIALALSMAMASQAHAIGQNTISKVKADINAGGHPGLSSDSDFVQQANIASKNGISLLAGDNLSQNQGTITQGKTIGGYPYSRFARYGYGYRHFTRSSRQPVASAPLSSQTQQQLAAEPFSIPSQSQPVAEQLSSRSQSGNTIGGYPYSRFARYGYGYRHFTRSSRQPVASAPFSSQTQQQLAAEPFSIPSQSQPVAEQLLSQSQPGKTIGGYPYYRFARYGTPRITSSH